MGPLARKMHNLDLSQVETPNLSHSLQTQARAGPWTDTEAGRPPRALGRAPGAPAAKYTRESRDRGPGSRSPITSEQSPVVRRGPRPPGSLLGLQPGDRRGLRRADARRPDLGEAAIPPGLVLGGGEPDAFPLHPV